MKVFKRAPFYVDQGKRKGNLATYSHFYFLEAMIDRLCKKV